MSEFQIFNLILSVFALGLLFGLFFGLIYRALNRWIN